METCVGLVFFVFSPKGDTFKITCQGLKQGFGKCLLSKAMWFSCAYVSVFAACWFIPSATDLLLILLLNVSYSCTFSNSSRSSVS